MNIVKAIFLEGPFVSSIIYFELAIRRDDLMLDWREICADDLSIGELVGKVADHISSRCENGYVVLPSPCTGTSAHVKHSLHKLVSHEHHR